MAKSSCFKNYEKCVVVSDGPLDALDCAVDLAKCLKKEINGPDRVLGPIAFELTDIVLAVAIIDQLFFHKVSREVEPKPDSRRGDC